MRLLTPLGLIALIGLLILLLIYLIKPTYQNKMLSTTYIWRESLKYKKGERPTSKLRNILLIICQVLIILLISSILATPLVMANGNKYNEQEIIILDASADMMLEGDTSIRFDRAKSETVKIADEAIKKHKVVSIVLSSDKAELIADNLSSIDKVKTVLMPLECSYSAGDLAGAVSIVKGMIGEASLANVSLVTATDYKNIGDIRLVNVADANDWNAAILDFKAELIDNYYVFNVDVASYGADKYVDVFITVDGANDSESITAETRINCIDGKATVAAFKNLNIFSFTTARASIKMSDGSRDGMEIDDSFILFGGKKPTIKIQYTSTAKNNFFMSALYVLQNTYADKWNIEVETADSVSSSKASGFDFYIYEHSMPVKAPTDGCVLLVNPDILPVNIDLDLGSTISGSFTLESDVKHALTSLITATDITATSYKPLTNTGGFDSLLTINGQTVLANDDVNRVSVLSINLNKSNLPLLLDFPLFITNYFNHYIPQTIEKRVYEVGEEINVRTRGVSVTLDGSSDELAPESKIAIATPGSYKLNEVLLSGNQEDLEFFVKLAKNESNVKLSSLDNYAIEIKRPDNIMADIYLYLAISLVVVVCLERFLYAKENI